MFASLIGPVPSGTTRCRLALVRRWKCAGACVLAGGWLLLASHFSALGAEPSANRGTNSRQAKEAAIRSIPFDRLPEDIRPKIKQVINDHSLFRRVPVQVIDCNPSLYLFLARHPEVVVNIWQAMGVSHVTLTSTGPGSYRGNDGAGTTGQIRLCYSNHDTQVVYAEGAYEGPMFSRPIRAQCVLVLRAGYVQETDGRHYITNRLDTFIHIDHAGLELLAKTLTPLVTKTVDINFQETVGFVGTVSRTAEVNPKGMERLAQKLVDLEPEVREQFAQVSWDVARQAADQAALSLPTALPAGRTEPRVDPATLTALEPATGRSAKVSPVKPTGKKLRR